MLQEDSLNDGLSPSDLEFIYADTTYNSQDRFPHILTKEKHLTAATKTCR